MKRLSWKYIAGLVDGEGCTDFQRHHDKVAKAHHVIIPRLRITLTENCRFVLDMLHENHGGYIGVKDRGNPNWQAAATWQLNGRKLRPLLQNIVNHLYIKKEQARFLIWYIDNMHGKRHEHDPTGLPEARKCAYDELKAMKLDPQRLSEQAAKNVKSKLNITL